MQIVFNGNKETIDNALTLSSLLKSHDLLKEGVAVAVDETIVKKSKWHDFKLEDGMNVDVFNMVTGG